MDNKNCFFGDLLLSDFDVSNKNHPLHNLITTIRQGSDSHILLLTIMEKFNHDDGIVIDTGDMPDNTWDIWRINVAAEALFVQGVSSFDNEDDFMKIVIGWAYDHYREYIEFNLSEAYKDIILKLNKYLESEAENNRLSEKINMRNAAQELFGF